VPWSPYIPLLGTLVCLGQMFFFPLTSWFILICWVFLGLLVYFGYGIKRSKLRRS